MIPGIKRLKALYVYEILSQSGETMSLKAIHKKLSEVYLIEETPKTLRALLNDMMEAGLVNGDGLTERTSRLHYKDGKRRAKDTNMYAGYYVENQFEDSELLWLIHNTIFSKQLTENKSNHLVKELLKLGTDKLSSKVGNVEGMKQFYHTSNPSVSNNIDKLSSAIHDDAAVQFIYTDYKIDKKLHPVSDEPITVKPARMVPLNGFYYLIAFEVDTGDIRHYRIDKMKSVETTKAKVNFSARSNRINIDEYLASHSLMFLGNPVSVRIKIPEDKIGLVIDRFGDDFRLYEYSDGNALIGFKSNESDLYVWALENGEFVEVIEPQNIRNRLRQTVQSMSYKYTDTVIDYYYDALYRAQTYGSFHCPDFPLNTQKEWLQVSNLKRLDLWNNQISNIEFVCKFPNLVDLKIIVEKTLQDITPLKQFSKLRSLALDTTQVSDIEVLANIEIKRLRLFDNKNIKDYSPIYEIKGLEDLFVDTETANLINMELFKHSKPVLRVHDTSRFRANL